MGPEEDALTRSGPDHISSLLEGGGPGPPGIRLSGLAFQSDRCAGQGPGESPENGHGGYYWEVGAIPYSAATGPRIRAATAPQTTTLPDLCQADRPGFQAHGPVHPHWIPAEAREDGQDLQGTALPHTSILQLRCTLFD